jgi:hypothetical protein
MIWISLAKFRFFELEIEPFEMLLASTSFVSCIFLMPLSDTDYNIHIQLHLLYYMVFLEVLKTGLLYQNDSLSPGPFTLLI